MPIPPTSSGRKAARTAHHITKAEPRTRVTSPYFHDEGTQRLPDYLVPNLDVVFCGINPGTESGAQRRHYAHRSNHFYRCVHAAGLTARLYTPQEDHLFPHATPYRLGLTNLAHRPTARSEQLTRAELEQGVVPLLRKVGEYYPRIVCFVGKHIAEVVLRIVRKTYTLTSHTWNGPPDLLCADSAMCTEPTTSAVSQRDRGYGLLPLCIRHAHGYTYLFVTPSTSARVTHHQLDGKSRIMSYLVPILSSLGENSTSNTTSTPYVIPCLDISTSSLRT